MIGPYKVHPFLDEIPRMTAEEFAGLVASIKRQVCLSRSRSRLMVKLLSMAANAISRASKQVSRRDSKDLSIFTPTTK
jgi:hypothetical protein